MTVGRVILVLSLAAFTVTGALRIGLSDEHDTPVAETDLGGEGEFEDNERVDDENEQDDDDTRCPDGAGTLSLRASLDALVARIHLATGWHSRVFRPPIG